MEKYFLTGLILCLLFISSSCSNSQVYIDVMEGNYAFSRGEYQEANLAYLNVKKEKLYSDYISYNLGNVYYALGEIDSAFEEWGVLDSLEEKFKTEITIRSYFNTGVLLFELSRYEEAYKIFRRILELDSNYINAKINLEYCIQKMNFTAEKKSLIGKTDLDEFEKSDDVSRVLDFVRRRETNIWKSSIQPDSITGKLKDW